MKKKYYYEGVGDLIFDRFCSHVFFMVFEANFVRDLASPRLLLMPMPALILILSVATVSEKSINDSALDENFLKSCLSKTTGTKIIEKSEGSKRCITFPRFALRFVVVVIIKESNTTLFKHIDLAVLTNSFPTLPSYLLH